MNWDELEKAIGVKRTVPPAPTRADADRIRRARLSKPWRKVRAFRKP